MAEICTALVAKDSFRRTTSAKHQSGRLMSYLPADSPLAARSFRTPLSSLPVQANKGG